MEITYILIQKENFRLTQLYSAKSYFLNKLISLNLIAKRKSYEGKYTNSELNCW